MFNQKQYFSKLFVDYLFKEERFGYANYATLKNKDT